MLFRSGVATPDADNCYGAGIPLSAIPVTEETKLTPASGIYAVTAAGDAFYSKAMAIVNNDLPMERRIMIHLTGFDKTVPGKKLTLFFHKKIRDLKNIASSGNQSAAVSAAFDEINELIF